MDQDIDQEIERKQRPRTVSSSSSDSNYDSNKNISSGSSSTPNQISMINEKSRSKVEPSVSDSEEPSDSVQKLSPRNMVMASETPKEQMELQREFFECPICIKVVAIPQECIKCQRLFCKDCLDSWLAKKAGCPLRCSKESNFRTPNRYILQELQFKQFVCENAMHGCKGTLNYVQKGSGKMKYKDAMVHIKKCLFRPVPCPLNCGQMIINRHFDEHYAKNCGNRVLKCPQGCGKKLVHSKVQEHILNSCPYTETKCEKCGEYWAPMKKIEIDKRAKSNLKQRNRYEFNLEKFDQQYGREKEEHDCIGALQKVIKGLKKSQFQDQELIQKLKKENFQLKQQGSYKFMKIFGDKDDDPRI